MSHGTLRPGWRKVSKIYLGAALRRINRPAVPTWQPRTLDTVHGNQLSGACSISQPQQEVLAAALAYARSEEHTSELQSLMRISYAVFCLKKKKTTTQNNTSSSTYITRHK